MDYRFLSRIAAQAIGTGCYAIEASFMPFACVQGHHTAIVHITMLFTFKPIIQRDIILP